MRALLREEMEAGALGLSTGLEYDPGIYSSTEEVVELAKVAAAHGGRYTSHIRSEDRWFWEAIDEILTIGREAQAAGADLAHQAGDEEPARADRAAARTARCRRARRAST